MAAQAEEKISLLFQFYSFNFNTAKTQEFLV